MPWWLILIYVLLAIIGFFVFIFLCWFLYWVSKAAMWFRREYHLGHIKGKIGSPVSTFLKDLSGKEKFYTPKPKAPQKNYSIVLSELAAEADKRKEKEEDLTKF